MIAFSSSAFNSTGEILYCAWSLTRGGGSVDPNRGAIKTNAFMIIS